jgi:5-methylcytosine-specific restriction endonuclease McrA
MPMPRQPLCKACGRTGHYKTFCTYTKRKPINQQGKEYTKWQKFRPQAFEKLIQRDGNRCKMCGISQKNYDIDHIITKGSRRDLKYDLTNLQLLCRNCHIIKTNHIKNS